MKIPEFPTCIAVNLISLNVSVKTIFWYYSTGAAQAFSSGEDSNLTYH